MANDRVIFSKGHVAPLLYSLFHAAGAITYEELLTLRKFDSLLEGHPTPRFRFVDVATGSLGQGLSVGVGMAIAIKLRASYQLSVNGHQSSVISDQSKTEKPTTDHRLPKVFVLLGDSEIDEGQVWEAVESAARYKLDNLIGILDVNKLGQYGETDEGWNLEKYKKKFEAFGWRAIIVKDGHDLELVQDAYSQINQKTENRSQNSDESDVSDKQSSDLSLQSSDFSNKPTMIIAKTMKGKGVSLLENKDGWHGKTLSKSQLDVALREIGKIDLKVRGNVSKTNSKFLISNSQSNPNEKINKVISKIEKYLPDQKTNEDVSTREAYGDALVDLGGKNTGLVVLDAGVANSTFENKFQKKYPDRFFEMSISEENMLGVAVGLSKMGFIPFLSTFAAFLTQTFDQVRMAQYSEANLKIVGSHAGVSIGQDGPSQMGLEDLAMMRSILNSVVFYPADRVSTKKLTKIMAENQGIFYLRTTRGKTPALYDEKEEFKISGSKVHPTSLKLRGASKVKNQSKRVLIIAAGITLYEALKAQKELVKENIETVVIDCYSVKPLDEEAIIKYINEYKNIIVVEDHYPYGGLGEAVSSVILGTPTESGDSRIVVQNNDSGQARVTVNINFAHLCVRKLPRSGKPEELLRFEEIDSDAIIKKAKQMVKV